MLAYVTYGCTFALQDSKSVDELSRLMELSLGESVHTKERSYK